MTKSTKSRTAPVGAVIAAALALGLTGCFGGEVVEAEEPTQQEETAETQEPADTQPAQREGESAETAEPEAPEGELGERSNPATVGEDTLKFDEFGTPAWEVTVTEVNKGATDVVMSENPFNEPPQDGNVFVMATVNLIYRGEDSAYPMDVALNFVTPGGNTFDSYSHMNVVPNDLGMANELYTDASVSGNVVFEVPADEVEGGTISVDLMLGGERLFYAVP